MARKAKKRRHNWVVCPWCKKGDRLYIDDSALYRRKSPITAFWVCCARCGVQGPGASKTVSWAVRKWNTWMKGLFIKRHHSG